MLISLFVFLFGAIVGSFLNVVILRYNTGRSVNGRSGCMTCGHVLAWYELIPILSFVIQKGRCRECSSKISWQYPLVELSTAILFTLAFYNLLGVQLGKQLLAFYFLIISLLVVITVYDIRHKIIPDGIVYLFALLSLLGIFLFPYNLAPSPYALISGPILFLPFFLLWFFSKGTLMGLGDGKLVLGIGWLLGLSRGLTAIILAFWIGAAVSVIILGIQKFRNRSGLTMKSEIPFGPFLILGTLIVLFTGFSFLHF